MLRCKILGHVRNFCTNLSNMEFQATGFSMTTAGDRQPDVLTVLLQLWMGSVLLAFLAGALCWKQCCSLQCQGEGCYGEPDKVRPNQMESKKRIEEDSYSSPPSFRVRASQSPSTSSRKSLTESSQSSISKNSRRKKCSNKQPSREEEKSTAGGIRGRPSTMERGRAVLDIMQSMASRASPSPWSGKEL